MNYGLPYQGSKNAVADKILDILPSANQLYDLFAGGCAITHAALLSGRYQKIHFNDISDSVVLFKNIIEGKLPDESVWISRDEFYMMKDSDPYVRIIWSFSNNQRDYLYSRKSEPFRRATHKLLFADNSEDRLICLREYERTRHLIGNSKTDLASYSRCKRLKEISRSLSKIRGGHEMHMTDYRNIEIPDDAVVYCDIPYKNTREYRYDIFDHEAFYDWCLQQRARLFISEYDMPRDRFECIAEFYRRSTFSATNNNLMAIERIFIPKHQL